MERSVAFVDMVTPTTDDPRLAAVIDRVTAALAGALRAAHRAGRVRRSVRTDDIMLMVGLVAALVAKMPVDARRQTADHAWSLLRRTLKP